MTTELPAPPIPADTDVRDLDGFMLNVERLMASELVALSSHEVIAAALFLWCRAWKQLPAASLPDDDRVIAAFARLPIAKFKKLRAMKRTLLFASVEDALAFAWAVELAATACRLIDGSGRNPDANYRRLEQAVRAE